MRDIEHFLNEALREVALEIRSVDVIELASNLHALKFANMGDIVHSALELHFRPGTIVFGYAGSVELGWFGRPAISLDLELHDAGVDVYFCLVIEAMGSSVHLRHAEIDGERWTHTADAGRIRNAFEQARLALADWPAGRFPHVSSASRLN